MGIESASDGRSIACLEGTVMKKLVAVAVGIVVDVAVGGNQSWNRLNFERTRYHS